MALNLKPLLENQKYIKKVEILFEQSVDLNLDNFRNAPVYFERGNIARWYFYVFGLYESLSKPWLTTNQNSIYKDSIVLSRSGRYQNSGINYRFLNKIERELIFIGVENEYKEMVKILPKLIHQPINDFLEMAEIINSCRLFIGNQSFPFSIAEGLKVKRILEVCPWCPNVIPEGDNGYDVYFQQQLESLVQSLLANN